MTSVNASDIAALEKLAKYIIGVRTKLAQPLPLLRQWGPLLVEWQQQNLERGVSPHGEPFAPLDPGYARERTRRALSTVNARPGPHFGADHARATTGRTAHPFGNQPLIDTTAMFATMKWEIHGFDVIGGATVKSERGYPYPVAHQEGRGVRKRAWSGLRMENRSAIAHHAAQFARAALKL